jgi:antitoxin ParD1/3/4
LAKFAKAQDSRDEAEEDRVPTRNISLTDHLDEFVEGRIASGAYKNASEDVREGLRLLRRQAQRDAVKLERLRDAIDDGLRAAERGEYRDIRAKDIPAYTLEIQKRSDAKRKRGAR